MSEYVKQAQEFLEDCNAKMKITYLGKGVNPNWDNGIRNMYRATITTPNGKMSVKFWDSINSTTTGTKPTEYDILACLDFFDGSVDDFINEFGYEINSWTEAKRVKRVYDAVIRQTKSIRRCFTDEQIEALLEIR